MSPVSPRRPRPSPPGESLAVSSYGGILAFVGALCFLIWFEYGYTLLLAVPVACLVALSFLVARLKQRDYEIYLSMFPPADEEPEPLPEPVVKLRPVMVHHNGLGQVMTYGRFDLPLGDWQKLARQFLEHGKITRRIVAAAGVSDEEFTNITETYAGIKNKMGPAPHGAGWFDRAGGLTDSGRVHFTQFIKPQETPPGVIVSHPPTPQDTFISAGLHETTTTTTGQPGANGGVS